jgi:hypothetical protein
MLVAKVAMDHGGLSAGQVIAGVAFGPTKLNGSGQSPKPGHCSRTARKSALLLALLERQVRPETLNRSHCADDRLADVDKAYTLFDLSPRASNTRETNR